MNMKTTLILAVLAVGVALVALWQIPKVQEIAAGGEGEKEETKKVVDVTTDEVDRVELETKYGGAMVFEKEDDSWMMREPMKARATKYQIDNILRRLSEIEYTASYDKDDKSRPEESKTGFDEPTARVALFVEGDKKVDLVVGSSVPLGKGHYLRKGDSETILVSKDDLSSDFNKKPRDFRDKQLLKRDSKNVARIRVEGAKSFEIVRDGEDWTIEQPFKMEADKARADRMANKICAISASDWIEDNPSSYSIYDLDEPRLKVTAVLEHEVPAEDSAKENGEADAQKEGEAEQPTTEIRQETLTLLIGGPTDTDAKSYFARFVGEDTPWVFSITDQDRKDLAPPLNELADKQIMEVDLARVTRIEADLPSGEMTLTKEKGNWYFAEGGERPADMVAVQDLLKAVSELKAEDFAEPDDPLTQLDWDNPRARIALTHEGKMEPTVLLIGNASASGRMVYVKNAAARAVAAVRDSNVEDILLGPIAYRDRSIMKFPRDRATRLEIDRRGSDKVALEQVNNQWKMVDPIDASADASAVRTLMLDLATLRAQRVVSVGNKAEYGLDNPEVRLAVHVRPLTDDPDTKVVGEEKNGSAASKAQDEAGTQPAKTQPAGEVTDSEAPGMSLEELLEYQKSLPATATQPGDVVANPQATQMLEELIARKGTTQPAATQPAAKDKKPAYTLEELLEYQKSLPLTATQPGDIAQNPLMTELLEKMIAEQNAEKKTDQASAADQKDQKEEAPAKKEETASTENDSGPTIFRLAMARHEGKVYGALEDSETVYELSSTQLDNAMAELHDRQIARFEVADVKEIAFEHDGRQATLSRVDTTKWKALEDPVLPIDNQKVTEALNDFRDLKTHRYVAYDTEDLGQYKLEGEDVDRVTVTLKDGSRISIGLSPTGPENDSDQSRYATLAESGKVFLLTGEQAAPFAKTLADFEKEDAKAAA